MLTPHRALPCATVLVSALLCFAPRAWAGAAHLAVVSRGADNNANRSAALVGRALREALSRDERYDVLDLNKALGSPDRERALRSFQSAEEMTQIGRESFDGMELGTAVEALNNALSRYEHQAAYVNNFKMVADVLMLLGATHLLRHEDAQAAARLEQAYIVYPQVEPDWHAFTPAMRSQFQGTVRRLQARPALTLTVNSSPPASEVYLDGRFVGVTPLTLSSVLGGRHYIRVDKDGYRPAGDVLEATHGLAVTYNATLRAAQRFDAFDALAVTACRQRSGDAVTGLANLMGANTLFLARTQVDHDTVTVQATLFDSFGTRTAKSGERTFKDDGQLDTYAREVAGLLQGMVGGAAGLAPAPSKATEAKSQGPTLCLGGMSCRSFKVLTLSVVGGLGVVAAGIGVSQWVVAKKDFHTWSNLAQTDPTQAGLMNSGKNAALRGDILVIAGGAMIAGSMLALLLWDTPVDEMPAHARWNVVPNGDGAFATAGWTF